MTIRLRIPNPAPTPEQIEAWQTVASGKILKYQTTIAVTSGLSVAAIWAGLVWYALTR